MNHLMAIMTNHQSLPFLCYHHHFPRLFSPQVLHLVYMVYFIFPIVPLVTAQLTAAGFQPAVDCCFACSDYFYDFGLNIFAFLPVNLIEFCQVANLLTFLRLVGDTPTLGTGAILVIYFRQLASVFPR